MQLLTATASRGLLELQERLELEVGMKREGLRWVFFSLLCTCYMVAFNIATAPQDRSEARWYIAQAIELDRLMQVASPRSVYEEIMHVTRGVREMTPFSSEFVQEPLHIVSSSPLASFA